MHQTSEPQIHNLKKKSNIQPLHNNNATQNNKNNTWSRASHPNARKNHK